MRLQKCRVYEGHTTIVASPPRTQVYEQVVYHPDHWALYDHGNKLISDSAYFRGPEPHLVHGQYTSDIPFDEVTHEAPDDLYWFLGVLHPHYGHFLLTSLARLWSFSKAKLLPRTKILVVGPFDATFYQQVAFFDALLKPFGIGVEDFASFDRPVRLRRVVVPAPCFEESNFVHRVYADMTRRMRDFLLANTSEHVDDNPVYLARYKVKAGVQRFIGEEDFAGALEARGVDIAFPEQFSVRDQIRFFNDRRNFLGFAGSAFHTAVFAPPRQMVMVTSSEKMLSNQVLIDRLFGHRSLYLYSTDAMSRTSLADYQVAFELRDPVGLAHELLRIADPFMRVRPLSIEQSNAAYGVQDAPLPDGSPPRNIALGRPTRQSSTSVYSLGLSAVEDSAGAVSGFCTGSYQFHTGTQNVPWWDVDLGAGAHITEIRIFNRLDAGRERVAHFALQVSGDGDVFDTLTTVMDENVFGGLDGHPFVLKLDTPIAARFLRILLGGITSLNLDQVVVLGDAGVAAN